MCVLSEFRRNRNYRGNGIQAACLSSETNSDEQRSILASDDLRLLYITPEFALHCGSLLKQIRKSKLNIYKKELCSIKFVRNQYLINSQLNLHV